jgi:FADH2 O2-dependent halogenase
MSMVLRRLGKTVLMVEQGKHPRFAIGESSTPFANLLLEKIATDYDLPFLRHFAEWGTWQKHHADIAVGLKRGFSFFHHPPGERANFGDRSMQLLVAASPNDQVADTHWYRPEFDNYLAEQATGLGVEYLDQTSVQSVKPGSDGWELSLARLGKERRVRTEFVIDATGANSVLAEQLSIPKFDFETMPKTGGVWAHFRNVQRLDRKVPELSVAEIPYPADDAAVHHIFPGGWVWVLRFNNGITSAGAAFTEQSGCRETMPEESWNRVLARVPALGESFLGAQRLTPIYGGQQLSFLRRRMVGANHALLPSAAGFVDPLLSTGFALTLLGVVRLGEVFRAGEPLEKYETNSISELEAVAGLVGALYSKMGSFGEFALLTLLYFAAMSFTETAWRLGKADLASQFLLTNDPRFSEKCSRICAAARAGLRVTKELIEEAIAPYDIAGLSDWSRVNWYRVDPADLYAGAAKLGASKMDIDALVRKLGLSVTT